MLNVSNLTMSRTQTSGKLISVIIAGTNLQDKQSTNALPNSFQDALHLLKVSSFLLQHTHFPTVIQEPGSIRTLII